MRCPVCHGRGRIDDLPLARGSQQPIVVDGRAELLPRDQPTVAVRKITPGYLRTMGIPLVRGRDVATATSRSLLVSRAAAKLLWGDVDPIGRTATCRSSREPSKTVIGIVGDVKKGDLKTSSARPSTSTRAIGRGAA